MTEGAEGGRSEPSSGAANAAEEGSTSVFTQNNQGPTLRAAQAFIKSFLGPAEGRLGRSDLSALCRVDWRGV